MYERNKISSQQASLLGMVEKFNENGLSYNDHLSEEENSILTLFLEGGTTVSIAAEVGLSKQRVSQILVHKNTSIYSKLRGQWQLYLKNSKRSSTASLTKGEILDKLESLDRDTLNSALKKLNLPHLKRLLLEVEKTNIKSEDIRKDLKF
ncbi:hypothetical protein IFU39_16530 [Paenibacillus sp. CFBP 13594]|uniref:hypothetical protein n=1 Tax=Paenibacillus sp. CFBP 13594 TaxID=2774037 RepID=UPI00177AF119|nr:hypothetical protein [Paenibacillus sp. CFBP 13594]MBD8839420.1 hypothetical protein [Paenibacillus sp. CFBP 13594]